MSELINNFSRFGKQGVFFYAFEKSSVYSLPKSDNCLCKKLVETLMIPLSIRISETSEEVQTNESHFHTRKAGWIQIHVNSMYAEAGIISKGKETWPEIRSDYFETQK